MIRSQDKLMKDKVRKLMHMNRKQIEAHLKKKRAIIVKDESSYN